MVGCVSSGSHERIHRGKGPAREDLCEPEGSVRPARPWVPSFRGPSFVKATGPLSGLCRPSSRGHCWLRSAPTSAILGVAPAQGAPGSGGQSPAPQPAQGAGVCRLPRPACLAAPCDNYCILRDGSLNRCSCCLLSTHEVPGALCHLTNSSQECCGSGVIISLVQIGEARRRGRPVSKHPSWGSLYPRPCCSSRGGLSPGLQTFPDWI